MFVDFFSQRFLSFVLLDRGLRNKIHERHWNSRSGSISDKISLKDDKLECVLALKLFFIHMGWC